MKVMQMINFEIVIGFSKGYQAIYVPKMDQVIL